MSTSAVLLYQFVTSMPNVRILAALFVVLVKLDLLEMEKLALVTDIYCMTCYSLTPFQPFLLIREFSFKRLESILVPRGHDPFDDQHQESRLLAGSKTGSPPISD